MSVIFGNVYYFLPMVVLAALTVGFFFIFRNRSDKAKKIFIFLLLAVNFIGHFMKLLIMPYSADVINSIKYVSLLNICAVSVITFPFYFLSKSKVLKDFMVYLGLISGFLAFVYPTETLDKLVGSDIFMMDFIRFYFAHGLIFMAPLLMMLLKVHRLDYKRIWRIPLLMFAVISVITLNDVVLGELGLGPGRGTNFFDVDYKNNSFQWGPSESDGIFAALVALTPKFMQEVPVGDFAGQPKFWPVLWIIFPITVWFTVLPFLICMIWEARTFAADIKKLWRGVYSGAKAFYNKVIRKKERKSK